MPIVNNILTKPVNWKEPYNYIGLLPTNGVYDAGEVCTSSLVNPESIKKPIKGNTAFYDTKAQLPDAAFDDPNTSGWEVVQNGKVGSSQVVCFNMRVQAILATDWKRMTDWDGYNKNSVGPGLAFNTSNISGYGQGSAFMGSGDTVLTLTAKVTFPTIRPGAVPVAPLNPSPGYTVELVRYDGNNRIVKWTLPKYDPDGLGLGTIHTSAQWAELYGGKTKDISITESTDLPVAGSSKDYTYYLEINGCHQRNGKTYSATARAWRQWQRFLGNGAPDPALYENITPTKTQNYGDIFYSAVKRLKGRNTGNASDNGLYLRIEGLFTSGNPPKIEVYANGTLIATCNNSTTVQYSNGAVVGYGNPQLSPYSYLLGSQTQTVQALDFEVRCNSIPWNASIELRTVSKFGI